MRILVTGGAGFIGSHLVEALLKQQHSVVVVDDFSTGLRVNLPDASNLVVVDADIRGFAQVVDYEGIDAVFHQAAIADVQRSWGDPWTVDAVNTLATAHLVEKAAQKRIPFIFASSSAVYKWQTAPPQDPDAPEPETQPRYYTGRHLVNEMDHTVPSTPYGVGKLIADHTVRRYGGVALRYFNVYGPRQQVIGPSPAVIPNFIDQLEAGMALELNGGGHQERDFIHVSDVVQANLVALEQYQKMRGEAFNVGTGVAVPVKDIARVLANEMGKTLSTKETAPRIGDVLFAGADPTRLQNHGWRVRMSLRDGLKDTIEWSKNPRMWKRAL